MGGLHYYMKTVLHYYKVFISGGIRHKISKYGRFRGCNKTYMSVCNNVYTELSTNVDNQKKFFDQNKKYPHSELNVETIYRKSKVAPKKRPLLIKMKGE